MLNHGPGSPENDSEQPFEASSCPNEMQKFVRPTLCRLCECPTGSDGVPMSDVDIVKLSRWWGKALETEFEDEELEKKFFCQFCLWDAKFQEERKKGSDGCDWWTGHDNNEFYRKNYFQDQLIRACAVRISPVELSRNSQRRNTNYKRKIPTKCIYCAESFESRRSAFRHVLDCHKEENVTFPCKTCCLHFLSKEEMTLHRRRFHPRDIICHLCRKQVNPDQLAAHMSKIHFSSGEDSVLCCGEDFGDQEQLLNHFKSVQVRSSTFCIYCEKRIPRGNLCRHVSTNHSDIAIKCHYSACGKYFLTETEKQKHVAEVHENKSELVMCVYCERKVKRRTLTQHVMRLHYSQTIRCTFSKLCCTYFKSETDREEHERQVHFGTKLRRTVKCLHCGQSLCSRHDLKKHIRTMHHLEPKICSIKGCSEHFLRDSELRNHFLEKHSANEAKKIFKCNECSYASRDKSNLQEHTQSKHRASTFKCSMCEKSFKGKNILAYHVATAHAEPKKCIHCGETQRSLYLYSHLKVVPCRKCKFVAPCLSLSMLHWKKCKHR